MHNMRNMRVTSAIVIVGAAMAVVSRAQTFESLATFNGTNGSFPYAALAQGLDGNFYGVADEGGSGNYGTIFKVSPVGALNALYSFASTDGAYPDNGLLQSPDGNLYGTTTSGGNPGCFSGQGCGTVFRFSPGGTLQTLYLFSGPDGDTPSNVLLQAPDGNLYGSTEFGATGNCFPGGCGTLFQLSPAGVLTTIHKFNTLSEQGGAYPMGAMVAGADGKLYGTTFLGGTHGLGTIFDIQPGGAFTTLYSFGGSVNNGDWPLGGLTYGSDGNLYGTTQEGGSLLCGGSGCGTVFKITPEGAGTLLHSFDDTDGFQPYGTLVEGTDGNFYGTTLYGGSKTNCFDGCGTIFKITPTGTLTTLHQFTLADGGSPIGGLVQGTDGAFYGTTSSGGSTGDGTVFRLSTGLGPFVKPLPRSGNVGTTVILLGTNLAGATSVRFNGTAAAFTVVSGTEISTVVPAGATSGKVQVTTPGGPLFSGGSFTVRM